MELNYYYDRKLKLVNNNFFIKTESGFRKIKGFKLKRQDKLVLFLHKEDKKFIVSDAITGKRISGKHKTKEKAKKFVELLIDKKTHKGVMKIINDNLKKGILSPRYDFVVKTCEDVAA